MKITDSMSDFEKEKAVYDWMTKKLQQDSGALTVIPSTQEDCDNPYGVLNTTMPYASVMQRHSACSCR